MVEVEKENQKPLKISLYTGRWTHRIVHNWLFSIKKNKWIRSHCHGGLDWSCDFYVYPGHYVLFSLHGFADERGAIFKIIKVNVNAEGKMEHDKELFNTDLPYEYYKKMADDPSCPPVLKDFLTGRPRGYHAVSENAPVDKTYLLNVQEIKNYIENFIKTYGGGE